eukprot:723811-Rhodomonas_salina.3
MPRSESAQPLDTGMRRTARSTAGAGWEGARTQWLILTTLEWVGISKASFLPRFCVWERVPTSVKEVDVGMRAAHRPSS